MNLPRTPRLVLVSTLALAAFHSGRAQTIDYILVKKQQTHTQLTTTLTSAPPTSAVFSASVLGSNLSGITAPTLTSTPGGTGSTGALTYSSSDDEWVFQQTYADGTALEAAYGAGNFGMTVQGQALTIGLPNETPRFTATPKATIGGVTTPNFVNGVLTWDVSKPLTLTLSDPGGTGPATIDHMSISVWGSGVDASDQQFGNSSLTLSFAAFAFTSGQTYTVDMAFSNIVGSLTTISGGALNGAQYGGVYERYTSFTISAIPEPSTYAAFAGAGALALAVWRRRRAAA